jgi:hypothetical protein
VPAPASARVAMGMNVSQTRAKASEAAAQGEITWLGATRSHNMHLHPPTPRSAEHAIERAWMAVCPCTQRDEGCGVETGMHLTGRTSSSSLEYGSSTSLADMVA